MASERETIMRHDYAVEVEFVDDIGWVVRVRWHGGDRALGYVRQSRGEIEHAALVARDALALAGFRVALEGVDGE
jgi:primosomal protein N'